MSRYSCIYEHVMPPWLVLYFLPNCVCPIHLFSSSYCGSNFSVWLPFLSFCCWDFSAADFISLWQVSPSTFSIVSALSWCFSDCMMDLAEGAQLIWRLGARMETFTPRRLLSWPLVGHRSCRFMKDGNVPVGKCNVDKTLKSCYEDL